MHSRRRWLQPALFCVLLAGCGGRDGSNDPYHDLTDPALGLVRTRQVGGWSFTAKYLPPEYLAWQHRRDVSADNGGSPDADYSGGVCFLLSIAPDEDVSQGDMRAGEHTLAERSAELNAVVQNLVTASYGGVEHRAVLAVAESVPGIGRKQDVMLVFPRLADRWKSGDTLDLAFDDRLLGTGIHHFRFLIDDLAKASITH